MERHEKSQVNSYDLLPITIQEVFARSGKKRKLPNLVYDD